MEFDKKNKILYITREEENTNTELYWCDEEEICYTPYGAVPYTSVVFVEETNND